MDDLLVRARQLTVKFARGQGYVHAVSGVDFDLRQDFRHAVDVGLAADKAEIGIRARLRNQMFAAAESDL